MKKLGGSLWEKREQEDSKEKDNRGFKPKHLKANAVFWGFQRFSIKGERNWWLKKRRIKLWECFKYRSCTRCLKVYLQEFLSQADKHARLWAGLPHLLGFSLQKWALLSEKKHNHTKLSPQDKADEYSLWNIQKDYAREKSYGRGNKCTILCFV